MANRVYDPIHDTFQENPNGKATATATATATAVASTTEDVNVQNSPSRFSNNISTSSTASTKSIRHLKKRDGEMFTRHDIQLNFMKELLKDEKRVFKNMYKEIFTNIVAPIPESQQPKGQPINVTEKGYDARMFVFKEYLTFSELYILTLASSTKGSKVLRDKLLQDQYSAFTTCVLALLVNFGKLNTTVNFFLEMTSQMRTFHSVPCLQIGITDPKSLQDTPRLKSMLKNIPIGNEHISLPYLYENYNIPGLKHQVMNPANLLLTIIHSSTLIDTQLIKPHLQGEITNFGIFDLLDNDKYDCQMRVNMILWIIYVHLETSLKEDEIKKAVKIFNDGKGAFEMTYAKSEDALSNDEKDVDTAEELEYGERQFSKRRQFLRTRGEQSILGESEMPVVAATTSTNEQDTTTTTTNANERETMSENNTHKVSVVGGGGGGDLEGMGDDAKNVGATKEGVAKDASDTKRTKEKEKDSASATGTGTGNGTGHDTKQTPGGDDTKHSNSNNEDGSGGGSEYEGSVLAREDIEDTLTRWAEYDAHKPVAREGSGTGAPWTQEECRAALERARAIARRRRQANGLLHVYAEYEDAPLATGVGVRGRKRRRYRDHVLGFETDFLRVLGVAKRVWAKHVEQEGGEYFVL
ncbi:hypothetical protein TBLA_0G03550 [Henningerozyma blattae CBS 6284]|uniref:Ino eighty subunit 1 n=1 Tax=Henningerozyma blattae (strain ATCC 34711 / CBS 6284 / DSM 70876 / NBRC 10599 / NRRL Y-10934 / UCD 77-7) TaxID=1071380 RepID=I2H7D9_HENB6|nr:hypothetical protein TBLA_0G03550 [Tetrapisispora blattae CBS 6284]CCH62291.1 hypothetical protein TBLA_0G03550 [Tetrapisispora blattae CBS 6284]